MQTGKRLSVGSEGLVSSSKASLVHRTHAPETMEKPSLGNNSGPIRSAYVILYDMHARATQLAEEAEAYLTTAFGGALTASLRGLPKSFNSALLQQGSTAAVTAGSLLQRCLEMQAVLSLEHNSAAASSDAVRNLASALSVLVGSLPADWQVLVTEQLEAAPEGMSVSARKGGDAAAASASGLVVCPSDLVQLALLLRRRWTLQRDLHLLVMALRDVCAAIAAGTAGARIVEYLQLSASEQGVPPPLMTVAVALGIVQIPHTIAMLEAHAERQQAASHPVGGTADAFPTYPQSCATTVLPAWLSRASHVIIHQSARCANARPTPCQTAAPATAVVAALSSARQITERIVKWETHVARYVSANLAAPSAGGAVPPTQGSGRDFLLNVQAEMSPEHDACSEVQIVWLTAAAATVGAETVNTSQNGSFVFAQVGERCSQVERTLRTLWPTSAIGRALLPGVLLLLGCACACCPSDPKALASNLQSRELQCYKEAYSLGKQVLGSAHPVVEATSAQQPSSGVSASGERPPLAPVLETRAVASSSALMAMSSAIQPPATANFGIHATPLPLRPQQQQQQYMPTGTLNRLPPLPSRLPPQAPPFAATTPLPYPPASVHSTHRPPPPPVLVASTPLALQQPKLLTQPSSRVAETALSRGRLATSRHSSSFAHTTPAYLHANTARQRPGRPPRELTSAAPLPGGRSLKSFYQLKNPADAFALRSAVQDYNASKQNDTEAQESNSPSKRKKQNKEKVPLTKAELLLSAISKAAPADGTSPSCTDADGNVRKRKNRDRDLLPPPPSLAAHGADLLPTGQRMSPRASSDSSSLSKPHKTAASKDPERKRSLDATSKDTLGDSAPIDLGYTVKHVPPSALLEEEQPHIGDGGSADNTGAAGPLASLVSTPYPITGGVRRVASDRSRARGDGSVSGSDSRARGDGSVSGSDGRIRGGDGRARGDGSIRGDGSVSGSDGRIRGGDGSIRGDGSISSGDGRIRGDGSISSGYGSSRQLKRHGSQTEMQSANSTDFKKNTEDGEEEEDDDDDDDDEETLPERNARHQREIMKYYAEINQRRVKAARVIQSLWRSSKAREILHKRQQILYKYVYVIQKAAALAIEGLLGCAVEQRRRQAALRARTEANNRRRELEVLQIAAAQRMTRAARQWLQRQRERRRLRTELNLAHDSRLQLYIINALKVQQWWRHVVVEKAYWRRRTVEVEEQRRLQAEADRQAHAAATIQKYVRGILTRRRMVEFRETREAEAHARRRNLDTATTVLAIVLQEYARRQSRLQREALEEENSRTEAARCIALNWQGVLEHRRLELAVERARQMRTSATCIQKAWRHYATGRQLRYLRQLRNTVNEDRVALEARTYRVIRLVQCFSRSAQSQLLARRIKARQGRTFMENLFIIQATGRGALGRAEARRMYMKEQARQRAAAAALQALRLHALCLSQALLRANASEALVQQRRRAMLSEKLVVRATATRELREEMAATILQRAVRRRQMRQRIASAAAEAAAALAFLVKMTLRIQQAWRAFLARRERRHRATEAAHCERKRLQQEEVWQLIWQDQFTELETLCLLERQYMEDDQHAKRAAIYSAICDPHGVIKVSGGPWSDDDVVDADTNLEKWANLYNE